jgi:hypothetical protein
MVFHHWLPACSAICLLLKLPEATKNRKLEVALRWATGEWPGQNGPETKTGWVRASPDFMGVGKSSVVILCHTILLCFLPVPPWPSFCLSATEFFREANEPRSAEQFPTQI